MPPHERIVLATGRVMLTAIVAIILLLVVVGVAGYIYVSRPP
ncbi:MAG: hypothetical protein P3X22_008010 [Thermoprotei archaeon]|nr:hypothetical protein [Thermoprotei archaeon]